MELEKTSFLSLFFKKVVPLENEEPEIALAKLDNKLFEIRLSNMTGIFVLSIFFALSRLTALLAAEDPIFFEFRKGIQKLERHK